MTYKAVAGHIFAGGFSYGVSQVHEVVAQLETYKLGHQTAEEVMGMNVVHEDSEEKWPNLRSEGDWFFANPPCSGYSNLTAGYSASAHGPWSKPAHCTRTTVEYGIRCDYPIVIFESVQQCYTVGMPLLEWMMENLLKPNGYRLCHLFINAATFGNPQQRKRYFFVAYKKDLKFNISAPTLDGHAAYHPMMVTAVGKGKPVHQCNAIKLNARGAEYDEDSYMQMTDDEIEALPYVSQGMDLNSAAAWNYRYMPEKFKTTWALRSSDMPFSAHCITRPCLWTACPTLASSSSRILHPLHNRSLTVGEISRVMGWPGIPKGNNPIGQIAKGVVPAVGKWLAEQVHYCLDNAWGDDDWEVTYNDKTQTWEGRETKNEFVKTINLTSYVSNRQPSNEYCQEHFGLDYGHSRFLFNRNEDDSLMRKWESVEKEFLKYGNEKFAHRLERLRSKYEV